MIEQQLVKPPQSRRGKGRSTVYRTLGNQWGVADRWLYVKTQENYNCRPAWRLWQSTPTFLCERRALKAFHALGMNVPNLMSCRSEGGIAELVLEEISDALPLHTFWIEASDDRLNDAVLELGRMVAVVHRAGWTHGALLPGHVLIQPTALDKVSLIDFEKARRAFSRRSLESDLARFWRRTAFLKNHSVRRFFTGYGSVLPDDIDRLLEQATRIRRSSRDADS